MPPTLQYASRTRRRRMDRLPLAAALSALYPLAQLAALYGSALATCLISGVWSLGPLDPPAIPPLQWIAMLLLLGSPLGLLASVCLAAKPLWDFLDDCYPVRLRAIALPVGLPLASWALAFALLIKDPGGVWEWFFD